MDDSVRGWSRDQKQGENPDGDDNSNDDSFADDSDEDAGPESGEPGKTVKKKKKKKEKKDSKPKSKKKLKDTDDSDSKAKKKNKNKKTPKDANPGGDNADGPEVKDGENETTKDKKKKKKNKEAVEEEGEGKKKKKSDEKTKTTKDKKKSKSKGKEKKDKTKKKSGKTGINEAVPDMSSGMPYGMPGVGDPVDESKMKPQLQYVEDRVEEDGDDSEAERMKSMLAQFDDEGDSSSEDSDDSGDAAAADDDEDKAMDDQKKTKAELDLNDNEIDHIILAAPDYEEACKEFETMTGIKPARLGGIAGLGIKAARVATDNKCYIEILAPDPNKSGFLGAKLAKLEEGSLIPYHYAIRESELEELQEGFVPNELGYIPDRINLFSAGPDGTPAKWSMLFMQGHFIGGVVPYYIDWGVCTHPLSGIPNVGTLKSLTVTAPGGSKVHDLLKNVALANTLEGDPQIEFAIGTPEGTITFTSENPEGITFPGTLRKRVCTIVFEVYLTNY
jgi:hypothetical protein